MEREDGKEKGKERVKRRRRKSGPRFARRVRKKKTHGKVSSKCALKVHGFQRQNGLFRVKLIVAVTPSNDYVRGQEVVRVVEARTALCNVLAGKAMSKKEAKDRDIHQCCRRDSPKNPICEGGKARK
jgi:hypothetical protein